MTISPDTHAENASEAPASYREAAEEIESILTRIERERTLDVDVLADQVERASMLIKFCQERLESAEVRVQRVTEELSSPQDDE